MCGVSGALSYNLELFKVSENFIKKMNDTMLHRGPDGEGIWVSESGNIGFGHRRLSIIDLSTSATQPMTNKNKDVWVTFNGEIYNHAEIREELKKTNKYHWVTDHSDTEVIVHAYSEWGIDCIHKFRGMFAIGIWDVKAEKLWLIRDRIGIKPLYYHKNNNRIIFASEIKALLEDSSVERKVNEEAFFHYLSFLTTPAPMTLFQNIFKLHPGTYLCIDKKGHVEETKYWDVLDHTQSMKNWSEEKIGQVIVDELREAVRLRKVADVPVGVFLSGGIDSSLNTALFSEGENVEVKTFSIGYDKDYGSYKNELHYAESVAKQFKTKHFEKILNVDDLMNFLPQMIRLQDEPIADPVCVPVYYVSKLARDNGVIVCQVGEGSDELFWGYPTWKLKLQLQKLNDWPVPLFLKKILLAGLESLGKVNSWPYEALRRVCNKQPVFWGGAESFTDTQKRSLLSNRLKNKFSSRDSFEALRPIWENFHKKAQEKSHLNWMSYLDLNFRLPELLLMRVDKMSMGVSLEGRVPFLDYKFVEMAMSIPSKIKTKGGVLKYILKKAIRGIITDEIIDRKKQGFGVPVYEWLFDKLGPQIEKDILHFCERTDYFDKVAITKMFQHKSPQLWYIYNFVLWHNHYIDRK